ncbi:hypothetical protein F5Y12DRAFT_720975 [Xylaria sp. FL1777]|nr:hypothetical protein F5Y12DRAFT_720975 [Xylaria sp. FL1777]
MPSSKGIPTDPELREDLKEDKISIHTRKAGHGVLSQVTEIKQEPNKSGGGEGQWSAWKAKKLAKEYEKQGGGYEKRD